MSAVALFKRCHGHTMMTNGERQKKKKVKTDGNSDLLSTPLTRPCVCIARFLSETMYSEKTFDEIHEI